MGAINGPGGQGIATVDLVMSDKVVNLLGSIGEQVVDTFVAVALDGAVSVEGEAFGVAGDDTTLPGIRMRFGISFADILEMRQFGAKFFPGLANGIFLCRSARLAMPTGESEVLATRGVAVLVL